MSDTSGEIDVRDRPDFLMAELREAAAAMKSDAFASFVGAPVLVSAPNKVLDDDEWAFRTGSYTAVRDRQSGVVFDLPDDHEVRLIQKHPDHLFRDTVLIGRTDACDVVIRDSSVSKLHARIFLREDGAFILSDAGSSNGTKIDHVVVEAEAKVQLPEAGIVQFGSRIFHVLFPARLWTLLRQLAATS